MNYKIVKISIDAETANSLINAIESEINKEDFETLEKRPVQLVIESKDEKIDIWFKVQFHSEFAYKNGGIECINRTAKVDIEMTDNETGELIEFESPISLDEEIEKRFYI